MYGLNFPSKEDALNFGQAVNTALENLRSGGSGMSKGKLTSDDGVTLNVTFLLVQSALLGWFGGLPGAKALRR